MNFFSFFLFTIMFLLWRVYFFHLHLSFLVSSLTNWPGMEESIVAWASLLYYYSTFSFPYESNGFAFTRFFLSSYYHLARELNEIIIRKNGWRRRKTFYDYGNKIAFFMLKTIIWIIFSTHFHSSSLFFSLLL